MSVNFEPQPFRKDFDRLEVTVKVDGVDVHYVQAGIGQDLVMVSGLLSSTRAFDFVLEPLSKNFKVTGVDLPGFGVSGEYPRSRRYSPQEHARTVVDLMDKSGIEKAGLIGDSYGCAVGLVIATECPEKISYLVLQGTPKFDFLNRVTKFPEQAAGKLAGDVLKAKPLNYWFRRLNPEFRNMDEEQLRNADDRLSVSSPKAAIEAGFDVVNFDFSSYASRLTVPTLIIEGDNPISQIVSSLRDIRQSVGGDLITIKRYKGSHTILQQQPAKFAEDVRKFAESVQDR